MTKKKERLDKLMVERGLATTRSQAKGLIMAGEVLVDGQRVDKPGTAVLLTSELELIAPMPYVSRGGFKLAGALQAFELNVQDRICVDVGACTGGFTDVLLQSGAARVYAIDVGYGQLEWKLRQDPRVMVMERTNARYLESLPEVVTFVSIDVSFISLKLILPAVQKWVTPDADIVALIKPQFEAGRKQVGKGGIVKDPRVHRQVLRDLLNWSEENGFSALGLIQSAIQGAEGNVEFLAWLRPDGLNSVDHQALIDSVLASPAE